MEAVLKNFSITMKSAKNNMNKKLNRVIRIYVLQATLICFLTTVCIVLEMQNKLELPILLFTLLISWIIYNYAEKRMELKYKKTFFEESQKVNQLELIWKEKLEQELST